MVHDTKDINNHKIMMRSTIYVFLIKAIKKQLLICNNCFFYYII